MSDLAFFIIIEIDNVISILIERYHRRIARQPLLPVPKSKSSPAPQSAKRPTVHDVARLAGVSQGSVSRVLTGKNWVSAELRAQVEQAARSLGYVPNAVAQSLKSQRTHVIAALVSDISNPLHGEFLFAAEERLQAAGHMLLVANTRDRAAQEQVLLGKLRAGRIDGLIVAHTDESNQTTAEALRAAGVPIVFHDRDCAALGDCVLADHRAGAYEVTRHLLQLGHRRIALLSPPPTIWPGRARLEGHRRALEEAGVAADPRLWRALSSSGEQAFSQTKALFGLQPPPSAVICLGTRMVAGVLTALASMQLSVPGDVSVVGIGDTDLVRLHTPPITTLRWDIAGCGRAAADLLLDRLGADTAGPREPRVVHVPVELVIRQSCAPQPADRRASAVRH